MAITTESQLVAAVAAAQQPAFVKISGTGKGAGSWHSYWTIAGLPGAGAAPGSINGAIPTDATAGAFPFNNPVSPSLTYLARLFANVSVAGSFTIYDRLWHSSGFSPTVTTAQAVTQPALTRYTGGEYNELWLEVYTATTAAATVTVTYTNQAGTTGRTGTITVPAATVAGQMIPMVFASGDYGIRSVQSVQNSVTLTAGNYGLTMLRDLSSWAIQLAGMGQSWDAYDLGLPIIADDACIAMYTLLSSTTVPAITGEMALAQG